MTNISVVYDAPAMKREHRAFVQARTALLRALDLPSDAGTERLGHEGERRLSLIKSHIEQLCTGVGMQASDWTALEEVQSNSDEIRETLEDAERLVRRAVAIEGVDQTDTQADQLARLLQWFRQIFILENACDCDVCAGNLGAAPPPYSFRNDGRAPVPRCLRLIAREIEAARILVEKLYGPYLEGKRLSVNLNVARPVPSYTTVAGSCARVTSENLAGATDRRHVDVQFLLPVGLGREQFTGAIYLAAHEIAVHGVQQWNTRDAPRAESGHVAFSEGLVDMAVFSALQDALETRKWFSFAPSHYKIGLEARQKQHVALYGEEVLRQGHDVFRKLRTLGESALVNLPKTHPFHPLDEVNSTDLERNKMPLDRLHDIRDGKSFARRVVLALNLMDLDENEREELLFLLLQKLSQNFSDLDKCFALYDTPEMRGFRRLYEALQRSTGDLAAGERRIKKLLGLARRNKF